MGLIRGGVVSRGTAAGVQAGGERVRSIDRSLGLTQKGRKRFLQGSRE